MRRIIMILLALMLFSGCAAGGGAMAGGYRQIDQETARQMMALDDGHVVVDVRRQDEYDAGHIPGAILIPNESIGCDSPEALPDYDQIILIYCRSGNRSKQAAQKLAGMGYKNIYEFGGINTWTGEIVTAKVDFAEINDLYLQTVYSFYEMGGEKVWDNTRCAFVFDQMRNDYYAVGPVCGTAWH